MTQHSEPGTRNSLLTVFGIRHHGPGCARSLLAALGELRPDIVLIEGPPDAQEVLHLAEHEAMRPPVALLVYAPDQPSHAVFYPFTSFSPEWQALRFALARDIPARFIDLPHALRFAPQPDTAPADEQPPDDPASEVPDAQPAALRDDPIGLLAEAAGYDDRELWWEHLIEQRQDAGDLFAGILEAMAAVRADAPEPDGEEARREAHMRQAIRAATREGFERIAVVCGAWHAPVLAEPGPAKPDAEILRGIKRVKTTATWIPWTNSRLSSRSGYGAGVWSPGWYEHLWTSPDRHAIRWVTKAAQLLRDEDLDASPASVVETVRLAEALASLRDLPMPGLAEMHEAIQTVLSNGEPGPMALIRQRLEIGEALGEVPVSVPTVPLQADLTARQRRLRLPLSAESRTLDLDLRNDTDLARSRLLHALAALGIDWGTPARGASSARGTFHELWSLAWRPELSVALIEANRWGNTVEAAATTKLASDAACTDDLPQLTAILDRAILASLPAAVEYLLGRVQAVGAVSADIRRLMDAIPPLARVARYGNVRGASERDVMPVIDALFTRILVGLAPACTSLDDDAAGQLGESIARVHESVVLLDDPAWRGEWLAVLRRVTTSDSTHLQIRGWCCRLLLEENEMPRDELLRQVRYALSPATPSAGAAAWIAGLTRGSGLLLLQQDELWGTIDGWLSDLPEAGFVEILPLLRRAFSGFTPAERRMMGAKVKALHTLGRGQAAGLDGNDGLMVGIDHARARRVLPVLASILGVDGETEQAHDD